MKENFINCVVVDLDKNFSSEQLLMIKNVLVEHLNDYDLSQKRNLPSVDLIGNDFILSNFLISKKLSGRSENTIKMYSYRLKNFLCAMDKPINKIESNDIKYYLIKVGYDKSGEKKCSNSYVDDARRVINSFFTFCEDENYVVKNPCKKIDKIKIEKKIELPYSDLEVEIIRNATTNCRDKALINLLLSTGIRREEASKIKLNDIDFNDRSIIIHGKGNKDRVVYFSAKAKIDMESYLRTKKYKSDFLFSCKHNSDGLSKGYIGKIISDIGKTVPIDNVHTHRFRKTFGTFMSNNGVPIQDLQKMLGHSKLDTTNDYYVWSNMDRIKYNYKNKSM